MIFDLVELLQDSLAGVAPVVTDEKPQVEVEEGAIITYGIALLFFLLGGRRGHSPLVFNRYAAVWIFVTLIAGYHFAHIVLSPGHHWLTPFSYFVLIIITAYARRCTVSRRTR